MWTPLTTKHVSSVFLSIWDELVPREHCCVSCRDDIWLPPLFQVTFLDALAESIEWNGFSNVLYFLANMAILITVTWPVSHTDSLKSFQGHVHPTMVSFLSLYITLSWDYPRLLEKFFTIFFFFFCNSALTNVISNQMLLVWQGLAQSGQQRPGIKPFVECTLYSQFWHPHLSPVNLLVLDFFLEFFYFFFYLVVNISIICATFFLIMLQNAYKAGKGN